MDDAVELIGDPELRSPIVITCEHASNHVPAPLVASESDQALLNTHWGYDIGAAFVASELSSRCEGLAILSRFSRLVCDTNRDPEDPTWITESVNAQAVSFNANLDDAERERRRERYHEPYHRAIDEHVSARRSQRGDILLVSIHSFTPEELGDDERRDMEVGILYDTYGPVAERLEKRLQNESFTTALNQPYSGLENLIYAANRHGQTHGVVYLELEIRQDLIDAEPKARAVAQRIANAINALRLRRKDRT